MAQTAVGLCDKELEFGALQMQTRATLPLPFDVVSLVFVASTFSGFSISQQSMLTVMTQPIASGSLDFTIYAENSFV